MRSGCESIILGPKKSDMAAIDYATCGMNDVIAHSLKLHPQLLADCLRSHARVHAEFADAYGDRQITRNELTVADRLHAFANAIELGDTMIPNDDDVRGEAFVRLCGVATRSAPDHAIMQGRSSSEEMRGMSAGLAAEAAAARTTTSRGH